MENAQRFRQIKFKKKAFWAKYNEKYVEVSAKYIPKKSILGKIQWRMRRGFGKIHTKKSILSKIQWKIRRGFGKIHTKKAFWAKYNGECVEVSAKYIQKKRILVKIQ